MDRTITFERFSQLVQEADYIEIGDSLVIQRLFGNSDQNTVLTLAADEVGLEVDCEFDPSAFPAKVDESGALFVEDESGTECEIHFYRGIQIEP